MAILKIARMGHPALRRRAEEVADPEAPEIRRLVRDMIETMADAQGLGLAAPQVHAPRRVVVFHAPPADADRETGDPEEWKPTILINPVIEPLSDEMAYGWEGCLSVPGLRGEVPRHTSIRYRGLAPDGGTIDRAARGLHARVAQHECDHLDGILYPMRMTDLSRLVFESEFHRVAEEAESGPAAPGTTNAAD